MFFVDTVVFLAVARYAVKAAESPGQASPHVCARDSMHVTQARGR